MKHAAWLLCALAFVFGDVRAADDYPSRPVRLVVQGGAGGGADAVGRLLADRMGPLLKATFVVENKPGAGGAIAAETVARAVPDGYTMLLGGASTHVLLPAVRTNLPYNSIRDFAPIGQIGSGAVLLLASNDLPVSSIKDVIEYAKASKAPVDYASWGVGSTGQFCGELMQWRSKIKLNHVPYKSTSQALTDLLGGHIKLGFVDFGTGYPMVKTGRVKAIASCMTRFPSLPEVPGFTEEGLNLQGTALSPFPWSLYFPAKTPQDIVRTASDALRRVLESPEVKAKLLEQGVAANYLDGDQVSKRNASDIEGWKAVVNATGMTAE